MFETYTKDLKESVYHGAVVNARGGGHTKNFDRNVRVTFLGLKFHSLLVFGLLKMRVIFWGLKNKH